MLMSLQEAENSEENIIFPSSFVRDTIGDVQKHFPLLYRNFGNYFKIMFWGYLNNSLISSAYSYS